MMRPKGTDDAEPEPNNTAIPLSTLLSRKPSLRMSELGNDGSMRRII